jgi:integrase
VKKKPFHLRRLPDKKNGQKRWEVSGVLNGDQLRLRFDDESVAKEKMNALNLQARGGPNFRDVVTTLSDVSLRDAEATQQLIEPYPDLRFTDLARFYIVNYNPARSDHTILTALPLLLEDKKATGCSICQRDNYTTTLNSFALTVASKKLHEIIPAEVEAFLNANRNWSSKTWNLHRANLLAFFNWTMDTKRKWVPVNPVSAVARKKLTTNEAEEEDEEPDTLPLPKARALMAELEEIDGGVYCLYFVLCLFCGIRPDCNNGEISKICNRLLQGRVANHFRLDSSNRKFRGEPVIWLSKRMTKDKRQRTIRIRPNVLRWLEKYPPSADRLDPKPLNQKLPALRKKFGLTYDVLRHTFITAVATKYGKERAAIESGNCEDIIEEHYLGIMSDNDVSAFWDIYPRP